MWVKEEEYVSKPGKTIKGWMYETAMKTQKAPTLKSVVVPLQKQIEM